MKNIKKFMTWFLIGSMVVAMSACNTNQAPKTTASPTVSQSAQEASTTKTTETSKASTTTATTTTTKTATTTTAEETTTTMTTQEVTVAGVTPTRRTDGDKIFYRDLELMRTDGKTDKLSSVAKKYTVVCYWQTGYTICLDQIAVLEALAKAEPEVVSVVMINTGESKETVAQFAAQRDSNLTFYLDEDSSIAKDNQVTRLPYMMFLTEELEVMGTVGGKINLVDFNIVFDKIDEYRAQRGE